jgi:DNA-directed RNA polymerase specialized sigma24 family protein
MRGSLRLPEQGGTPLNTDSSAEGEGFERVPRQTGGGTIPEQLYEALKEYRDRGRAGGLEGQRVQRRLFAVLNRVLSRLVRGDSRLLPHEVDDATQYILIEIFQKVDQCKALNHEVPERRIAGTFSWVRTVFSTRLADWLRKEKRHAVPQVVPDIGDAEADELGDARKQAAEDAEQDALQVQRQAAEHARAFIRRLIQTGQPEARHREAKKLGVGSTLKMLNLQLLAFEEVRLKGRATHEVGVALGVDEERKTVQDRVSKWVERGRKALLLGAQLALEEEQELVVKKELEKLAHSLAQPMRLQRRTS